MNVAGFRGRGSGIRGRPLALSGQRSAFSYQSLPVRNGQLTTDNGRAEGPLPCVSLEPIQPIQPLKPMQLSSRCLQPPPSNGPKAHCLAPYALHPYQSRVRPCLVAGWLAKSGRPALHRREGRGSEFALRSCPERFRGQTIPASGAAPFCTARSGASSGLSSTGSPRQARDKQDKCTLRRRFVHNAG